MLPFWHFQWINRSKLWTAIAVNIKKISKTSLQPDEYCEWTQNCQYSCQREWTWSYKASGSSCQSAENTEDRGTCWTVLSMQPENFSLWETTGQMVWVQQA